MPHRVFHFLCVFLLLFAQQSAIVHATWHATGPTSHTAHDQEVEHETPAGQDSQGGENNLCALDLAFGQVLGGVQSGSVPPLVVVAQTVPTVDALNDRLSAEAIPALSRGPPILL